MNPALLLNPKAFKKAQAQKASQERKSAQDGAGSANASSTSLRLLDPKAKFPASSTSSSKRGTPSESDGEGPGMAALIEKMHQVEPRAESFKRRKVLEEPADEGGERGKKKDFGIMGGDGSLSNFLKKVDDAAGQEDDGLRLRSPPLPVEKLVSGPVVDLTNDVVDDDIQIVSTQPVIKPANNGDQEVCLGKIEGTAQINLIPTPKTGPGLQPTATHWPAIKVELVPEHSYVVQLRDPTMRSFGRLDLRTAQALLPLMKESSCRLRLRSRLESRKRVAGELAGSPTSRNEKIAILVYARRSCVDQIGRHLHQHSVVLKDPVENIGMGTELLNPHAPRRVQYPYTGASGPATNMTYSAVPKYITRTQEETTHDVMNMIDSLTKTEELPEMAQDPRVTTELLAHQKQALHFLTEREKDRGIPAHGEDSQHFNLWKSRIRSNGQKIYYNVVTGHQTPNRPPPVLGGLLADLMGLGKTLSILSLIVHTLDEAKQFASLHPPRTPQLPLARNSRGTLLIAPLSVVSNWEVQIRDHITPGTLSIYVYHGGNRMQDSERLADHDIVITSYHTVAAEMRNSGSKKPIVLTNWFRIVLDEAHQIRNQSTSICVAVCALSAQRRWSVTATPIQNKFDDIGAQFKFLRIKPFDEEGAFGRLVIAPFRSADPNILPKFRLLLDSITLRRVKDTISLPERIDQIVRLDFSETERAVYQHFVDDAGRRMKAATKGSKLAGGYGRVLKTITRVRRICAHGESLLSETDMKLLEGVNPNNAIELDDEEEVFDKPALAQSQAFDMLDLLRGSDDDKCGICDKKIGDRLDMDDEDYEIRGNTNTIGWMTPCYQVVCPDCFPTFQYKVAGIVDDCNFMTCPMCNQWVRASFFELKQSELDEVAAAKTRVRSNPKLARQLGFYRGPHTKTKVLIQCLKDHQTWSDAHPDENPIKSVIFSEWTDHLDLIQIALEDNFFKYSRLDGTMNRNARKKALHTFDTDPSICVILVSIKSGGLGINLTVASKVYVMEPLYNPAAEAQAVDRVHRLGQKRVVEISRFIMRGSFEERILDLQRKKLELADLSMNRKMDKAEKNAEKIQELRDLFR